MLFKTIKIYLSIALLAILMNNTNGYCQVKSEALLYNWFDDAVGKENLGINNGTLNVNTYHPFYKSDSYYVSDLFDTGDLSYDGQFYYAVKLKYDIYKDILLLKPNGQNLEVVLNKEKVNSFTFHGKKFSNLNYSKIAQPDFVNGFFEIIISNEKFSFYIKHHKDIKEIIKDITLYNEFNENNEFVLNYKNTFFKIDSKKDIIKLFPEYKKKINEYYSLHNKTEKLNHTQFMENLMLYINNFLPNLSY